MQARPAAPAPSSWVLERVAVPQPDAVVYAAIGLMRAGADRAYVVRPDENDRVVGLAA